MAKETQSNESSDSKEKEKMKQPTTKKKLPMQSLGRNHVKQNLARFYPFLLNEFRHIKHSELGSEQVFCELFPDAMKMELEWIRAIYIYQQCDTKHRLILTGPSLPSSATESQN